MDTFQINIRRLFQKEADRIMKGLSGCPLENFKLGFDVEKENMSRGRDHTWALPSPNEQNETSDTGEKRIYYLIILNEIAYLMIGINPLHLNLSSFARVTTEEKGLATKCLKKFIEDILVPMCRQRGKQEIAARIATDRSERVIRRLQQELPRGIRTIRIDNSFCSMKIDTVDG